MTEGTQARPERVMVLEPDAERRQMLAQTLIPPASVCLNPPSRYISMCHVRRE